MTLEIKKTKQMDEGNWTKCKLSCNDFEAKDETQTLFSLNLKSKKYFMKNYSRLKY